MRSNWAIWDFLKSRPNIISGNSVGVLSLYFADPYFEKIALSRLTQKNKLVPLVGSEITRDWIENNLLTMDLFGSNDSYLILLAEDIPAATKDYLLTNPLTLDNRLLVFSFSRNGTFFDKWSKLDHGEFIKFEAVKFWEGRKLIDFLCQEFKLTLPYEVSNFLLESISIDDSSELYHFLGLLQLYSQSGTAINLGLAQELLGNAKLDHFKLANLFCQRKFPQFWLEIENGNYSFDQLRSFFFFMSSHLFKIYDPKYLEAKNKLSKYDQEILAYSKKWKQDELLGAIRHFSELELKGKAKDHDLLQAIREQFILLK